MYLPLARGRAEQLQHFIAAQWRRQQKESKGIMEPWETCGQAGRLVSGAALRSGGGGGGGGAFCIARPTSRLALPARRQATGLSEAGDVGVAALTPGSPGRGSLPATRNRATQGGG
ncbi:hypothetical protein PLESTB_000708300 [Pleodorina starrii]|uniref:Uncharacterized protein n=1 Tax=Pleodorina starrii TaxID=330485 RepID=A0A9W6EX43_9CHLO|nr:hypothetical protein PLESTM_001079800 [Pleodorina starrii]GLC48044.1 hypothetical protein PLESTB_000052700 [Pleodorina starrii]GLC53106.1 hypothetical protein PLESTB_000708300 [Pleodorina starrii]GLC69259.1 hypothetical protein PLESTF_000807900 [Pleodorina starrii]